MDELLNGHQSMDDFLMTDDSNNKVDNFFELEETLLKNFNFIEGEWPTDPSLQPTFGDHKELIPLDRDGMYHGNVYTSISDQRV